MSSVRALESLMAIAARAKSAMLAPAATTETAARRLFVARAARQPRLHTHARKRAHRKHKIVRITTGRFCASNPPTPSPSLLHSHKPLPGAELWCACRMQRTR